MDVNVTSEIVLSFVMGGFFLAGAVFSGELKQSPTIAGVIVGIVSVVATKVFCNFIL